MNVYIVCSLEDLVIKPNFRCGTCHGPQEFLHIKIPARSSLSSLHVQQGDGFVGPHCPYPHTLPIPFPCIIFLLLIYHHQRHYFVSLSCLLSVAPTLPLECTFHVCLEKTSPPQGRCSLNVYCVKGRMNLLICRSRMGLGGSQSQPHQ